MLDPNKQIIKIEIVADSAASLADQLLTTQPCPNYTFFCGNPHRPELKQKLTDHGVRQNDVMFFGFPLSKIVIDYHLIYKIKIKNSPPRYFCCNIIPFEVGFDFWFCLLSVYFYCQSLDLDLKWFIL